MLNSIMFISLVMGSTVFANTHYSLNVKIAPSEHTIVVSGRISGPPQEIDKGFFLNKNFTIQKVTSGKKSLHFDFKKEESSLPYVDIAKKVALKDVHNNEIEFAYQGQIQDPIDRVNFLNTSLIELAVYSGWYPYFKDLEGFTFDADIELPSEYVVTGNWETLNKSIDKKVQKIKNHSLESSSDIVIIASKDLKSSVRTKDGLDIEMFHSSSSSNIVTKKLATAEKALAFYQNQFGNAGSKGLLRFVYSPRAGWGYSRMPLFVVSEEKSKERLTSKFGFEEDIHIDAHELAHFWWSIANVNTEEDWINEGFAEYSAFAFCRETFGKDYEKAMLDQYFKNHRYYSDRS